MPRSFSLAGLSRPRDLKTTIRVVLGALLAANLVALAFVARPWGGSAAELESQVVSLQGQVQQRQAALRGLRTLATKVETARAQGEQFLGGYFLNRSIASSTIEGELRTTAQRVGVTFKEHTISLEPVEGSDDLSMLTINGNYEGGYGELVKLVNEIDRSPRLLIIETLTASPMQGGKGLRVTMRMRMFVREGR